MTDWKCAECRDTWHDDCHGYPCVCGCEKNRSTSFRPQLVHSVTAGQDPNVQASQTPSTACGTGYAHQPPKFSTGIETLCTNPVDDEVPFPATWAHSYFEDGFERGTQMAPNTSAQEWRERYLWLAAINLALVEYLTKPDATVAGAMRILTGHDPDKDH